MNLFDIILSKYISDCLSIINGSTKSTEKCVKCGALGSPVVLS